MFGWLCVALGVAFGSAVVPLISAELFVIGLASSTSGVPWLAIGIVVAAGQVAGKLLFYLAARGSIRLPPFLADKLHGSGRDSARKQRWRERTKRVRVWLEALRERCHRHPHWMTGTYGASAVFGLPPFMATTVLAGLVRMPMSVFLTAGLLGRCIRFSALAASPAMFAAWLQF
ncbi:YqaA family protein [Amycolatopsis aidingensis]|uniref:hypothetical protein n=1 Tax=Amycolatopsis aidingensis TaxID=2842453 RepID=UPI001C0C4348|nr:hypothetical protein [Amycolatopsis aidingensis]